MKAPTHPPLPLDSETPWGKIKMVAWVGERYYWMIDQRGDIAMMPADMVEGWYDDRQKDTRNGSALSGGDYGT